MKWTIVIVFIVFCAIGAIVTLFQKVQRSEFTNSYSVLEPLFLSDITSCTETTPCVTYQHYGGGVVAEYVDAMAMSDKNIHFRRVFLNTIADEQVMMFSIQEKEVIMKNWDSKEVENPTPGLPQSLITLFPRASKCRNVKTNEEVDCSMRYLKVKR